MLLFVMFHKDTNTGVEDQKGVGSGGWRAMDCTHLPWPAVICLSKVNRPAYLPAPTDTHLAAA